MQKMAASVEEYINALSPEKRDTVIAVRDVIRRHLAAGFEEGMQYGMIGYYVPHSIYPAGYHCDPRQPLPYAGLAAQKNHYSLYLGCVYSDPALRDWFTSAWIASGRRFDAGKGCVRFRSLEGVPLDVVADLFRRATLEAFVAAYEAATVAARGGRAGSSSSAATRKAPATRAPRATARAATTTPDAAVRTSSSASSTITPGATRASGAKKTGTTKAGGTTAGAKKTGAKKTGAKKTGGKKTGGKRTGATRASEKKSPTKTTARSSVAKKAAATRVTSITGQKATTSRTSDSTRSSRAARESSPPRRKA